VKGRDEPGIGPPHPVGTRHPVHRLTGDLTVLVDGRLALMTPDERVHGLGEVLAALVGEAPDALGDRHIGRVRLVLEVVDRHERLSTEGMVAFGSGRPPA
jgi:hypothetical protein